MHICSPKVCSFNKNGTGDEVIRWYKQKVELWLSGAGREGNGDLLFNGHGVSA